MATTPRIEMPLTADERTLLERMRRMVIVEDPVEFCVRVLGFKPWTRQAEVLRALTKHRRVAVRSGNKLGKSVLAAAAALWWFATKRGARVVITAPTGRSIREVVWREVSRLHKGAVQPIGGKLAITASSGLVADDGRQIIGYAADSGEAFSGISGENVFYIVDEASGVDEEIWDAIERNRAGGASLLAISNPTQVSGTFYRAFHEQGASWDQHVISGLEAVAYQEKYGRIPGLVSAEYIAERRADGWPGTVLWSVGVEGEFPREGTNVVIGLGLVEAAQARWTVYADSTARLLVGVDVARFGDDESVVQLVRGLAAYPPRAFRGLDGPQLAARVVEIVEAALGPADRAPGAPLPRVKVDVIGVGASAFDALKRIESLEVVAVNVGESATTEPAPGEPGFSRLRDQVWFAARAWLMAGGALPNDSKLKADLVAPRFGFALDGRCKVEGKDDMKKRLGRSPDRGDALCLAVFEPVVEESTAEQWGRFNPTDWA